MKDQKRDWSFLWLVCALGLLVLGFYSCVGKVKAASRTPMEVPEAVVQAPNTNVYRITLAWDDPNPPGTIDHYVINMVDTNGVTRTMTTTSLTNEIWYLSTTNRYRMWVRAVGTDGLDSDYSTNFVWRPDVVTGVSLNLLAGPSVTGAFTNAKAVLPTPQPGMFYKVEMVQTNNLDFTKYETKQ